MGYRKLLGFRSTQELTKARRRERKQSAERRQRSLRIENIESRLMLSAVVTSISPSTGPTTGGTTVTIVGTGLAAASVVDFGTVPGSLISDSATQIIVSSPAETAGTVDITVTTAAGTSAKTLADRFSFTNPGPALVSVVPNVGSTIVSGTVLNTAPSQLTLRFNAGEAIVASSLTSSPISVAYTNAAGTTSTLSLGYVGVDDTASNEVDVRFSQTLLSGTYQLTIASTLQAKNSTGTVASFNPSSASNLVPVPLTFSLDLGSMVSSVVPQPVTRTSSGGLQQSINEVDVYFTDAMSPASAENTQFYQLIGTDDSADSSGQLYQNPTYVNYIASAKEAQLFFTQSSAYYADPNNLSATDASNDLNSFLLSGGSFETPVVGVGSLKLDPTGSPWTFASTAGISSNSSSLSTGNANAPAGSQAAYLTDGGSMSETVSLDAGTYSLSFAAAQSVSSRTQAQQVEVLVDGKVVNTTTLSTTSSLYSYYQTPSISIKSTGPHTIEFLGLAASTANTTALIDRVTMTALGAQSIRLRIGDAYQTIATQAISLSSGEAGTSYGTAYTSSALDFNTSAQSDVFSNEIAPTSYSLQFPGGADNTGNRKTVNDPGVVIEGGFENGVGGSDTSIPTYTYNFPTTYGLNAQGQPAYNEITAQQEQDTREIFELYSYYLGVQFEESSSTVLHGADIGVITGDLFPLGKVSGGGIVGLGGGGIALMDDSVNYGTSPFGGEWMLIAMHEINHNLGYGHSAQLAPDQIMDDDATQGTSELLLPGIGDLTTGLNMFRPDDNGINMYKVVMSQPGTLSAETVAQRLTSPSLLNTELRLFQLNSDGSYSPIAQNDDYFGTDSYVSLDLPAGTYYVGVSASGNNAYDPDEVDTGMGGTTEGNYQLRVNFTPQETLGPAVGSPAGSVTGNIALYGAGYSVSTSAPFGEFSSSSKVTTITGFDALDVQNVATLNGETITISNGTSTYTFQFVDTSVAGAQATNGYFAIDYNSTTDDMDTIRANAVTAINDAFTVLVNATGTPFDGDADGTPGGIYSFWFNVAGTEVSGIKDRTIFVDKTAASGGTGTISKPYTTIAAALTLAASDATAGKHDIVRIEGNHTSNDFPSSLSTLADNVAYEIGTNILGQALPDGSQMVVPNLTTVMIDAGAVIDMLGTNIQVGSSEVGQNLSGSALQVLGTPLDSVYFTSYYDKTVGKNDDTLSTAPKAGNWGGLVFENDLDNAYDDTTPAPTTPRPLPESEGIFLDSINHAVINYGGGSVSVNSVTSVYDPIYMVQARVTASYDTIENSNDAAMSADPNSFQESFFEGNSSGDPYTDDYERNGPSLNANTLISNSINGLLVRIRTNAGEPTDTLTTSASFASPSITYVVSEPLEVAGNPGGPYVESVGTSPLQAGDPQQIVAVDGSVITDGQTFTLNGTVFEFNGVTLSIAAAGGAAFSNGDLLTITDPTTGTTNTFEFEVAANAVTNAAYTKITYAATDDAGTIAAEVADAINSVYFFVDPTTLEAIPLPYSTGGGDAPTSNGTIALAQFTIGETFTFTTTNATPGLTEVGNSTVANGHVAVDYSVADNADLVANEVAGAIIGSGLYSASSVTVQGSVITINDPAAVLTGLTSSVARLTGRLNILPGVVVKFNGGRIETQIGATLIAEGTSADPVVLTSINDDRYGSGGTFDLTSNGYTAYNPNSSTAPTTSNTPQPGDWSGIYAGPATQNSIDHAVIAFAGGVSSIEGGFAGFNAVESRQGLLRVTNSLLEYNADGTADDTDSDRNGRGDNGAATIFIRGAQPIIAGNIFLDNDRNRGNGIDTSPVISIDVNSLNSDNIDDWGRATGLLDAFTQYDGNFGPLVRGNVLSGNGLNGMLVRSGVLSDQSVWDDTDIVYIVEGEISVPNLHTYGGLRIESSSDASLVVKLLGANAGFTAAGRTLDTTDVVGGEVQLIGQPGFPVVLTSLYDTTVGAGLDLNGNVQTNTDPSTAQAPAAGDWRSVLIEQYSNDRNVQTINQVQTAGPDANTNGSISNAQYLGELATSDSSGDENLRLGFEVHGDVPFANPADSSVYSFTGTSGTDVYIAMDLTSFALDSVLELLDANGNVIARSDNKAEEDPSLGGSTSLLSGLALPFQEGQSAMPNDDYSDNPYDPALRVQLPGPAGQVRTYYVRVYSALKIDTSNVTNVATLNGTTFQVADSNTLAIGNIDSNHIAPGIGGIGSVQPGIGFANLNLTTFSLTVGSTTVTFQLVDTSIAGNKAAAGNRAIDYNSTSDDGDTLSYEIAQAITAAIPSLTATTEADDSIALSGASFVFKALTSPFEQQNLTGLNDTTFQITDAEGNAVTFEFVDTSIAGNAVTAGNQAITYNSTTDTVPTIQAGMTAAINSAFNASDCQATLQVDGSILLTGLNVTVDLGQTPFLAVGSTHQGANFQFIDSGAATPATLAAGDQPIYYNSSTDDLSAVQADIVQAINSGSTVINGIDSTTVPSLSALNGETFTIGDSTGGLVTYEFVDVSNAASTITTGDIPIFYDSATDTIADIRQDIVGTINDYTAITGVDSTNIPSIASLDQQTFTVTDGFGNQATFEFIDTSGSSTLSEGVTEIAFDSQTDTIAQIRQDMANAINSAGLDLTALAQSDGVALFGEIASASFSAGTTTFSSSAPLSATVQPDGIALFTSGTGASPATITFDPGTTAFGPAVSYLGANCGVTAQLRSDGTIGLYGNQITFTPSSNSPLFKDGRTSGSYQLQVRLQADMEIPGSEIEYTNIRYATDGIDIQGQPDSSPLLTDLNSVGTNTTFNTAQPIGNLLNTTQGTISVAGELTSTTDINWYSFQLAYQDIELPNTETSYPLMISVGDADGLARPDTEVWVFNSAGTLIFSGNDSDIVDNQSNLGNGVTDPTATSYGASDPYIGPIQLPEDAGTNVETYYIAVTGIGETADALTQNLLRQEPIDSVNRVVEDEISGYDAAGIADQTSTQIDLTPAAFSLNDVTLYTTAAAANGTSSDVYTSDPFTGTYETDVTNAAGVAGTTAANGLTDISMREDGNLYTLFNGNYEQIDTGTGAIDSSTADAINAYATNAGDTALVGPNGTVTINALSNTVPAITQTATNPWNVFGVGNAAAAPAGDTDPYPYNLLYQYGTNGATVNYPGSGAVAQAGSDVTPLAALLTGPTITAVPATDPTTNAANITDGETFSVTNILTNTSQTYQFVTAAGIPVNPAGTAPNQGPSPEAVRNLNTFTVSDGTNTKTFELISGPVLTINTSALVDGDTFTLKNTAGVSTTFEIDLTGTQYTATDVAINLNGITGAQAVVNAITAAITGAGVGITSAGYIVPGTTTSGRISLLDGSLANASPWPTFVASANDKPGVGGASTTIKLDPTSLPPAIPLANGDIPINYLETETTAAYGAQLVAAINTNMPTVTASFSAKGLGGTLYILGATSTSSFTGTPDFGTPTYPLPLVAGNIEIGFTPADTAATVATEIAKAINLSATGVTATANGAQVYLVDAGAVTGLTAPLTVAGQGPGGNITGMTYLSATGTMYVVSDQGGLYELTNYNNASAVNNYGLMPGVDAGGVNSLVPTGAGATLTYLGLVESAGVPIKFSGLTFGPPDAQNGIYANDLFATDSTGNLYAMAAPTAPSATGAVPLLPIFLNGATSIPLTNAKGVTLTNVTGLSFSNIDYNLWDETTLRSADAGHGINPNAELSEKGTAGGVSYYFGLQNPTTVPKGQPAQPNAANYTYFNSADYNTYNVPGGARGSLISETPFSLAGYTSQDCPALYFNYYIGANANAAANVYITNDGSKWVLLDNITGDSGGWLQAVLNLGAYAGDSTLQLRFDFSTAAGDMGTGDTYTANNLAADEGMLGGAYLTALPGDQLKDGDNNPGDFMEVGAEDGDMASNFEFDLGAVLDIPGGAGSELANGQTFTIDDGTNPAVTFEIDNGSDAGLNVGTNTVINVNPTDSPTAIAAEIAAAVTDAGLNVTVYTDPNQPRVEIVSTATPSTLTATVSSVLGTGNAITMEGDGPGNNNDGNTVIPVNFSMTAAQVATEVATVFDATLTTDDGPAVIVDTTSTSLIHMIGHNLTKQAAGGAGAFSYGPLAYASALPNEPTNAIHNSAAAQNNLAEGFYIDDIIVGFQERGQMITGDTPDTTFDPTSAAVSMNAIPHGSYELQITRAPQFGTYNAKSNLISLDQSFDTNDRMTNAFTLVVPAANAITNSDDSFTLDDGGNGRTFEFVLQGLTADKGDIPIYYAGTESASAMAELVNTAINNETDGLFFTIYSAWNGTSQLTTTGPSNRVDLFNAQSVTESDDLEFDALAADGTDFIDAFNDALFVDEPDGTVDAGGTDQSEPFGLYAIPGDKHVTAPIGETIVDATTISYSANWGILVEPGTRDATTGAAFPGSNVPLPPNNQPISGNASLNQVGGVVLENNVIDTFGDGGIDILGNTDVAGEPTGAIPFYRVINNTIYGGDNAIGVGINVAQNAAPTLLNNIIDSVQDAVTVDGSSSATVLDDTLYQNISAAGINTGIGTGGGAILLQSTAPLFVDADAGNFYPAAGSQAVDTAQTSLPDRPGMVIVETALHLPQSPILAPDLDELGQLAEGATLPGIGSNFYKDRGAIDRVDTTAPTAQLGLVEQPTDSSASVMPIWVASDVTTPAGESLSEFAVQLLDTGTGIDNTTVASSSVTVYRSDNPTTPLVLNSDYFYSYDSSNHIIYLTAGPGVWAGGFTYTIVIDNSSATGVKDVAGNSLSPNQFDGTTSFIVTVITDEDFSHAPGYPVAYHGISSNLYLGVLAPLPQAYYVPSLSRTTDDGISPANLTLTPGLLATTNVTGVTSTSIPVTVTNHSGQTAYLSVWLDSNDDSTFEADEQVVLPMAVPSTPTGTANPPVMIQIAVPSSAVVGDTWLRFRLSTTESLGPAGGAPDGEVEDYLVNILPAPGTITGNVYSDLNDDGAHETGEPGLADWTITATSASGATTSTTSAADGSYTITVAPGVYTVQETLQAGWTETAPTTASPVTVITQQATVAPDFDNFYPAPTVTGVSPNSGTSTGGAAITISGTNLTGITAVDFGGVAAPLSSLVYNPDGTITINDPAEAAGEVDVTVVTPGGTSTISLADEFTYLAIPTVSGITPAAGPVAGGTTVTISGQNLVDITAIDFGSVAASLSSIVYNSNGTVTINSPAQGPGEVDVTVINTYGTSGTSTADQFTYFALPVVLGVVPNAGPLGGGTSVTISGTTLTGITAIDFGSVAASLTSLVYNPNGTITIADPAESAGTVDVTVTTPGGTSTTSSADKFTYLGVPTVTAITPVSGPLVGGTAVTITGTNLTDITAVDFGAVAAPLSGLVYNPNGTITINDPAGSAGTVNVTVVTLGGTSTVSTADQFTYFAIPTVTSITPLYGPLAGGTSVTISGANLTGITAVDFGGVATSLASLVYNTNGTITINDPAESASAVNVTVTTPGGTSAISTSDLFTYLAVPTVTGITPTAGPLTGGTSVTITGSSLTAILAVDFGATPASLSGLTYNANGSITIKSPAKTAGTVNVTIVTSGGTSLVTTVDQFTYLGVPTVTAITPTVGPVAGGTAVTISGANLLDITAVDFGSTPAALASLVYNTNGTISISSPAASAGTADVTIVTPGGTSTISTADQFTYYAVPVVVGITPTAGPLAGGEAVTIIGSNLTGVTAVDFGSVPASLSTLSYNANGSVTITSPAESAGIVAITLTTPGGTSATSTADLFTYLAAPTVTAIAPTAGPSAGGRAVTITGTNFTGVTAVDFGGIPADLSTLTYNTNGSITVASPAQSAGIVAITVTTLGGTSATSSADLFTYVAAPTVTAVAPTAGPLAGGRSVTITGTNLAGITAVDFGGIAAPLSSLVYNVNGTITVSSPAEAAGTVNITVVTTGGTSAISTLDQFVYLAAPTSTIVPAATQALPALSSPVTFTVTFSNPVTGFSAAGISLAGSTVTGATVTSVTGSGTTWTVTVGGMTGSGAIVARVLANSAIDLAGNFNLASTAATSIGYYSAPLVTIATAANQSNPVNHGPLYFTVTFNQPVTDFTASDLSFAGSTAGGRLVATVTSSGGTGNSSVFGVTVTGMTSTGLVKLSMPAGLVLNAALQTNLASTGTTNSVFYDINPATESLVSPAVSSTVAISTLNSQGFLEVAYSAQTGVGLNTSTITDAGAEFTLSGTAAAKVSISNSKVIALGNDRFEYPFTGSFTTGTVSVKFIAGSFLDNAGNPNTAATYSFNVEPGVTVNSTSVTKPTSGTVNAVFTVSLAGTTTSNVTVKYTTANGTNTVAGRDYKAVSGTLTFKPGQATSQTVSVPVIGNTTAVKSPETFSLVLSSPVGAALVSAQGTGTIVAKTTAAVVAKAPAAPKLSVGAAPAAPVKAVVTAPASPSTSNSSTKQTVAIDAVIALLYSKTS